MTNYDAMTKAQLIELLGKAKSGENRKQQVLDLLNEGYDTIEGLADQTGMTKKNVSSVLSGLRKQGHVIITLKIQGQSILKLMTSDQLSELTK